MLFIGYVRPNAYKLKEISLSWNNSRAACIKDGMDLAVISDYDVLREVREHLRSIRYFSTDIWIGLKWSVIHSKFVWVNKQNMSWPDDQDPWASEEPNCHKVICEDENTTHTCVRMSRDSSYRWKWRTHACHLRHYAICQNLSSPTRDVSSASESVTTNCSSTVTSTTIDSPTTSNSVTISLATKIKSTATSSSTSIELTVTETSPEPTKTQTQTQLSTKSATTLLSANSKLISTMESTELPIIVTTINMESSFNASTEYITNGTLFNNCTQKCPCKSVSIKMNNPKENYRIDKRQTSAYIRRHSSAYDGRLSSRIIGYTGAAVICTIVLIVISFDIINLMKRNEANK
ncbi:unnamed protein product [Mytilus edulis]|uniref:C-type lectin domain-containing protein n=1 Tax=Mytilus edulis TaxID=6550 RepID=A0A8S3QKK6_MYTED|nr:unnamed protein product [Mytilus edulis]